MTHPYFVTAHAYTQALRRLIGHPEESHCQTLSMCSSGPVTDALIAQIREAADDTERDMLHVAFADAAPTPIGVSLALRQYGGVLWLPECTLYAATETAKIEILGGGRRWHVGQRNVLTGAKLPPRDRRARGEAIALRRWHQAVATGHFELPGVLWMTPGDRIADALARDEMQAAA